jgi:hypothetical protein
VHCEGISVSAEDGLIFGDRACGLMLEIIVSQAFLKPREEVRNSDGEEKGKS